MTDEKVLIAREAEVQAEVIKRLQGIKRRADMYEIEKSCENCNYLSVTYIDDISVPCKHCTNGSMWKCVKWLDEWLSSFDSSSATKCFEAVNLLKERLRNE